MLGVITAAGDFRTNKSTVKNLDVCASEAEPEK